VTWNSIEAAAGEADGGGGDGDADGGGGAREAEGGSSDADGGGDGDADGGGGAGEAEGGGGDADGGGDGDADGGGGGAAGGGGEGEGGGADGEGEGGGADGEGEGGGGDGEAEGGARGARRSETRMHSTPLKTSTEKSQASQMSPGPGGGGGADGGWHFEISSMETVLLKKLLPVSPGLVGGVSATAAGTSHPAIHRDASKKVTVVPGAKLRTVIARLGSPAVTGLTERRPHDESCVKLKPGTSATIPTM